LDTGDLLSDVHLQRIKVFCQQLALQLCLDRLGVQMALLLQLDGECTNSRVINRSEPEVASGSALEGDGQAELNLPWRPERINTRADSDAIYIVARGSGSVDLSRGSRQQSVECGAGQ